MSTISLGTARTIRVRQSPAQHPRDRGARTSARPALRLTRRGRLVVLLVALVIVLAASVALGSSVIATDHAGAAAPTSTVTVQPGQTLWDIAGEANPSGDIRHTVHDIAELNSLPSAGELQVGQEIAVPRY